VNGVALSSDQAPKPSNHPKTSLSVNNFPLVLPTPFYLNLPTYSAEQTAQPLYKPASGTHVTTAYPVHASGSPIRNPRSLGRPRVRDQRLRSEELHLELELLWRLESGKTCSKFVTKKKNWRYRCRTMTSPLGVLWQLKLSIDSRAHDIIVVRSSSNW
jgi:hypothetical protein